MKIVVSPIGVGSLIDRSGVPWMVNVNPQT
jgi:uncharacterized glyoxalase superfamily protein PhnB